MRLFFVRRVPQQILRTHRSLRRIVQPCDEEDEKDDQFILFFQVMEHRWNEIDRGKPKYSGENRSTRGKTCPSATLSTTNSTWNDQGSNPGLRGICRRLTAWAMARPTRYTLLRSNMQSGKA
jgi:hypothetical protein